VKKYERKNKIVFFSKNIAVDFRIFSQKNFIILVIAKKYTRLIKIF